MWRILAMFAVTSCLQSELVVCDDGRACPVGFVCDEIHASCVSQEQLDACVGIVELASCMTRTIIDGVCHDGVCLERGCGNTRLDPGEVCDDGNLVVGDGCSIDCLSDETCGNGVLDLIHGERCDDGNRIGHDGCDSTCGDEEAAWSNLSLPANWQYPVRDGASIAYDDGRQRAVQFGGLVPSGTGPMASSNITAEWDGRGWIVKAPHGAPPGRTGGAMAYDPDRRVIVLFGGIDNGIRFGDTWTWDGSRWRDVTPDDVSPPVRNAGRMAYDEAHHEMILFGGQVDAGFVDDTWSWDGTHWRQIQTTTMPSARMGHQLAYDPVRGELVLFGGFFDRTDTWVWNGTAWEMRGASGPAGSGLSFSAGTLTFDRRRQELILISGTEWWAWTGTTWSARGSTTPLGHLVFDANLNRSVVVGETGSRVLDDTMTWSPLVPSVGPSARSGATAAFDRRRGRLVLFGGEPSPIDETWELDGSSWELRSPATVPPARAFAELAYDEARSVVVMVGGYPSDDSTWEWDGSDWHEVPASAEGITGAAVAFDPTRGRVVRYGGSAGPDLRDELREWDGASWTRIDSSPRPNNRNGHAMAYDRRRQRLVVWGGSVGIGSASSTWEWDGTAWHAITISAPTPRSNHAMTYDDRRGEIIMFGSGSDTWTYDGHWRRINSQLAPSLRLGASLAYNATLGEVTLFGGQIFTGPLFFDDLWRLRWDGASYDSCATALDFDGDQLAGCADPDCYGWCDPLCPPRTSCVSMRPRCGDLACDPLETRALCPSDCGSPPTVCGDHTCGTSETIASCPGDCT